MELTPEWWDGPLAEDHHVYLRSREKMLLFYHMRSPQLGNRRYLVDWLAIICDDYNICPTARHLMIALLDYFMDNHLISDQHLRLAALAAFLIACKKVSGSFCVLKDFFLFPVDSGICWTRVWFLI